MAQALWSIGVERGHADDQAVFLARDTGVPASCGLGMTRADQGQSFWI